MEGASNRKQRNEDLKKRTKEFVLRIIKLVDSLPSTLTARTIGGQLIRSGTSVPANYRAACRARSNADFIAKLGIVEEETDESVFWIEMLVEAKIVKAEFRRESNGRRQAADCNLGKFDKHG